MALDRKSTVLVIDDEEGIRALLQDFLVGEGFEVVAVADGEEGLECYGSGGFELVLLDLAMPKMDGMEVLRRLKAQDPQGTVVIMTAHGSFGSVVEAMKGGAEDYLGKPLDLDHLAVVLHKALKTRAQRAELTLLKEQMLQQASFEGLVGVSRPMQQVYALIQRVAGSDTTVLIQGETGTGKELVARAIHRRSTRHERAFMPISCGALAETILEGELFGHEKGAFTGAIRQKLGLLEQAEEGTLFLDEIEAMSPALQVKLLRALQEREVLRVGGAQPIPVDFRVLAATNADLRARMEEDAFRADLFYRLSVVVIDLPPLRRRAGDVPLLARHFAARHAEQSGRSTPGIAPETLMLLQAHGWPGNVRELENVIEQAVVLRRAETITPGDLPPPITALASAPVGVERGDMALRPARERFEQEYLEALLARVGGNVAAAAQRAGVSRQQLYKKMKRYGISPEAAPGGEG